jgi:hypothetical protein
MSDEQASLDIVIRTRAETEGVEELAVGLGRGIGAAERLGEALGGSRGRESIEESAPVQTPRGDGHQATEHESPGTAPRRLPGLPGHTPIGPAPDPSQVEMPDMRDVELQAKAIVAMGEQIRAAVEENGRTVLDVLHRILASIEHQNYRLSELDKELGQLAGRVKGSKNP